MSARVPGGGQPAVEIESGADERQVCEGLRKVAQVLRLRPELLAIESEMIGVAEHLLEEEAGLLQITHARQALDIPERAHRERALGAREAVGEAVAQSIPVHERIAHQLTLDAPQGGD